MRKTRKKLTFSVYVSTMRTGTVRLWIAPGLVHKSRKSTDPIGLHALPDTADWKSVHCQVSKGIIIYVQERDRKGGRKAGINVKISTLVV